MRSSKSCGGKRDAATCHAASKVAARCRFGWSGQSRCSAAHQSAPAARCASAIRSSSVALNSGLRKACASARRWPGETSTSSTAIRSRASGASINAWSSTAAHGTCSRCKACATRRSDSRLRQSTMMSPGRIAAAPSAPPTNAPPCPASSACTAVATSAASRSRSTSSASVRGVVSVSRHTGGASLLNAFGGRNTRPMLNTPAPGAAATSVLTSVVWARKPLNSPAAPACANTLFSAAITSGALRRVWSHSSSVPPSACTTNSRAASNTRGSARRKR